MSAYLNQVYDDRPKWIVTVSVQEPLFLRKERLT